MSNQEMKSRAWNTEICDSFSWRGLLSQKYHLDNLNLAQGGSSNQCQFRLAIEFFGSPAFQNIQKQFDRIVVIWGITSTARNEIWSLKKHKYHNFFLSSSDDEFARFMVQNSFDHDCEVHRLRDLMLYWNVFFESQQIKNFWFDTFNTHHYTHNFLHTGTPATYHVNQYIVHNQAHYCDVAGPDWPSYEVFCQGDTAGIDRRIMEEIRNIFPQSFFAKNYLPTTLSWASFDEPLDHICNLLDFDQQPRDLMSWLMMQNNIPLSKDSQSYHDSAWQIDRDGMLALVDAGILNPYSYHPTKLGHRQLCDYFIAKLQAELV